MTTETAFVLRPMRLVELLDAAFRLYRRNFWTLIGVAALVTIPGSLLALLPQGLMIDSIDSLRPGSIPFGYYLSLGLSFFVGIFQFFLSSGLGALALTRALAAGYLGEKPGVFDTFRQILPALGRYLLVILLCGLMLIGFYIWLLIPCLGWFSGLGILLTLSMAILPFSAPVVLLENESSSQAISRTWDLIRRRFWWVIGLMGVLYLLNLALAGPSVLLTSISDMMGDLPSVGNQTLMNTIVQLFIGTLVNILYMPLQFAVVLLAYFDLRARTEGIDLLLNAGEGENQPVGLNSIAQLPRVSFSTQLVTGSEIGYFVILTLGGFLAYAVLVGIVVLIFMGLGLF
jgi:hypothetical protein